MEKMMNLPTDFVRRAAANVQHVTSTVTSTVSTVANVATGRRNSSARTDSNPASSDGLAANAKDKVTLNLKCTPSKDALTTSSLAVKAGYLMKRNEQGNWQNRFLCVVPHMFLYYYDTDMGEAPRGVIDLELYTNVTREDVILKVMPSDEGPGLRSFFFNHEDPEYLNEWITSLIRDRYHAVCDERNAYQQMQFDLTGAIDQASTLRKMSEKEREDMEKQLSVAQREYIDCKSVLTQTLVLMGITEEDMGKLTDPGKLGQKLRGSIGKMKEGYERRIEQLEEQMEELRHIHVQELVTLQSKLDAEVGGRKNLESLVTTERQRFLEQIAERELQVDSLHVNMNILSSEKQIISTKARKLNEEKKVLIKEIKALRSRGEELEKIIGDIGDLNRKIEESTRGLMGELEGVRGERDEWKSRYQELLEKGVGLGAGVAEDSAEGGRLTRMESSEGERDSEVSRDSEFTKERIGELLNFNTHMRETLQPPPLPPPSSDYRSPSPVPGGGDGSDHHHHHHPGGGDAVGDDVRESWDLPHPSLQQLPWLSEEQKEILTARIASAPPRAPTPPPVAPQGFKRYADTPMASSSAHAEDGSAAAGGRRSSMSMLLGAVMGASSSSSASSGAAGSSGDKKEAPKRTSMFSSLLGSSAAAAASTHATTANTSSHAVSSPSADPHAHSATSDPHFFSSPFSRHPSIAGGEGEESGSGAAASTSAVGEENRLPLSHRLKCLRCAGSVEGPKYSTCKCSTPALLPEDLEGAGGGSMLRGIWSRGSVAGGLVGGMVGGLAGGIAGGLGSLLHGSVHGDSPSTHGGLSAGGVQGGAEPHHIQGQLIIQAVPRFEDNSAGATIVTVSAPATAAASSVESVAEATEEHHSEEAAPQEDKAEVRPSGDEPTGVETAFESIQGDGQEGAEGRIEGEMEEEGDSMKVTLRNSTGNSTSNSPLLKRKQVDSDDEEDTAEI